MLLSLLLALPALGQDTLRREEGSFYTYPTMFALRLVFQERELPLLLEPLLAERKAVYNPNSSRTLGLGGSLFGISYTFSFQLPEALQRDAERYGATTQRDLRVNAFAGRYGLLLDRQDYTGYYLDNIGELDPDWQTKTDFPFRQDLRVKRLGVGLSYLFQPDSFSYSAALNNRKRQRIGGGTFLVQVYGGRLWIGGDSLLLPRSYFYNAGSAGLIEEVKVYHASLMPGYAHTFVLGKFYLMTSLALGPELQRRRFYGKAEANNNNTSSDKWEVEGRLQMQAAFGYDDDLYFCNIAYTSQQQQYEVDGLGIGINTNGFRLLVGRRFEEVGFMKRIRNWSFYKKLSGAVGR